MSDLLGRINLELDVNQLVDLVLRAFGLSTIVEYELIDNGYEELNIKLWTQEGAYVAKIFNKDKSPQIVRDYVKGLNELYKAGIPVPRLILADNNSLVEISTRGKSSFCCLMEYFAGESFQSVEPDNGDLREIVRIISKIHQLSFKISENYDSWGTAHLVQEFALKKGYLDREDFELIEPIVSEFQSLRWDGFTKCIVHGDLQRAHVLKDKAGHYCILDLGCMTFGFAAVDLAIFLAFYCIDENGEYNKDRYEFSIREYQKMRRLNGDELDALPLLILGTYAIYSIASQHLARSQKDSSKQTNDWIAFGKKGLRMKTG